jgi:hypothetical protein
MREGEEYVLISWSGIYDLFFPWSIYNFLWVYTTSIWWGIYHILFFCKEVYTIILYDEVYTIFYMMRYIPYFIQQGIYLISYDKVYTTFCDVVWTISSNKMEYVHAKSNLALAYILPYMRLFHQQNDEVYTKWGRYICCPKEIYSISVKYSGT